MRKYFLRSSLKNKAWLWSCVCMKARSKPPSNFQTNRSKPSALNWGRIKTEKLCTYQNIKVFLNTLCYVVMHFRVAINSDLKLNVGYTLKPECLWIETWKSKVWSTFLWNFHEQAFAFHFLCPPITEHCSDSACNYSIFAEFSTEKFAPTFVCFELRFPNFKWLIGNICKSSLACS